MRLFNFIALMLLFFLWGCSSTKNHLTLTSSQGYPKTHSSKQFDKDTTPDPALLENACTLLDNYPHWRSTLSEAKSKWQLDPWFILAFIHQESRFNPNALSSSKAYGYPQAKDDTWKWYQEKTGNHSAKRNRFDDSVDFMGFYVNQNTIRNKVAVNDVKNQYLAYHEGMGGFERSTYIGKPWLLTIADKVLDRAALYQAQLLDCPIQ